MSSLSPITIIMAGGLGKRMNSDIPKVLHEIQGKPMIYYVIKQAIEIPSKYILVVVGKYKPLIQTTIESLFTADERKNILYIDQPEKIEKGEWKVQGTGFAVKCCIDFLVSHKINPETPILILSGDVPLIKLDTIQTLLEKENTILITKLEIPYGCGRIVFGNPPNTIDRIIEEKDCSITEKNIKYVNCGIYVFPSKNIIQYIPMIKNENKNQEYYLTDIIQILRENGIAIHSIELPKERQHEVININTTEELILANKMCYTKLYN